MMTDVPWKESSDMHIKLNQHHMYLGRKSILQRCIMNKGETSNELEQTLCVSQLMLVTPSTVKSKGVNL